jgi:hypothetical protein
MLVVETNIASLSRPDQHTEGFVNILLIQTGLFCHDCKLRYPLAWMSMDAAQCGHPTA